MLLKKKLEEKERVLQEKTDVISEKEQQLGLKDKLIVEREETIKMLTTQLEDRAQLLEEMQRSQSTSDGAEVVYSEFTV